LSRPDTSDWPPPYKEAPNDIAQVSLGSDGELKGATSPACRFRWSMPTTPMRHQDQWNFQFRPLHTDDLDCAESKHQSIARLAQ